MSQWETNTRGEEEEEDEAITENNIHGRCADSRFAEWAHFVSIAWAYLDKST